MSWHRQSASEIVLAPADPGVSAGHCRAELVGTHVGAVHTGLTLCAFVASGGRYAAHVHSTEESFYVLEGGPILTLDGVDYRLGPDDCGLIPVGATHSWSATGEARWLEVHAPAPRAAGPPDTFFLPGEPLEVSPPRALDIRDPRTRAFFHLGERQMELDSLKLGAPVDAPTVSASMATALLAYSGIGVKMLVDQRLGAALHTMFMVEYEPGGVAQPHDHPLEEAYYILLGEVEATADDETFLLGPGDVLWTGVGQVHSFTNRGPGRVRWLETQSPQPPARHSYRFNRDWDYLAAELAKRPPTR